VLRELFAVVRTAVPEILRNQLDGTADVRGADPGLLAAIFHEEELHPSCVTIRNVSSDSVSLDNRRSVAASRQLSEQ
jgi:hypothetical protein